MKREILFRGKTADTGEWIEGYPFFTWGMAYISWGMSGERICATKVIPETIGQFTGLTDKNGVKIFEGDILSSESWCVNSKCKRRSHIAKWGKAEWIASGYNGELEVNPPLTVRSDWGVIGNIHNNPELSK